MNENYKIIGEDGKEYGPVAQEQIRKWITEGRVESRTPVFVDGAKDWNFVGLLPEFTGCFAKATPPTIAPPAGGASAVGRLPKTNGYAQAGLIFGILSLICCCAFPFGLLGLIFSLIGLSQINARPELHEGRVMAVAGLILSIFSLLAGVGWVLFQLVFAHPHVMWQFGSI